MIDIEKAVLAIIMRRGGSDKLAALKTEYFQQHTHRRAFEAMRKLYADGKPIDVLTLGQELNNASYAVDLNEYADMMVCTEQELEELVTKLKQKYTRAVLMQATKEVYRALANGKNVEEAKAELMMALENLETGDRTGPKSMVRVVHDTIDLLETQYKRQQEGKFLTTHLTDLNDIIGGLMPQDLILIGARPSVGKTAIALDIARHVAHKGHTVMIASLEMSAESLCIRYMASMTEMNIQKIRTGKLEDEDWAKLSRTTGPLTELPIFIDDESRTITQIKVAAKEVRAQRGCDLIIVDYIQLLQPEGRHDTREQEVASISRGLKLLAKEMDIPVIALAQLNREAEGRKPTLAHLRESGAQEQDADLVLFLWEPPEEELKGEWKEIKANLNGEGNRLIELIVAKQRNGPTGATYLCYIPGRNMFMCLPKGGRQNDRVGRDKQKS